MNRSLGVVILTAIELTGRASPPRPVEHPWSDAVTAAQAELAACVQNVHAVGDVTVRRTSGTGQWLVTASRSLGAAGPKIAACAQRAIEKHYVRAHARYIDPMEDTRSEYTLKIGAATVVLPPVATFVPAWRAAIAKTATREERARFAKLLPPDYKIDKQCVKTDRPFALEVEQAWLETTHRWVPRIWQDAMTNIVGYKPWFTAADGNTLVTLSVNGVCLEEFDSVRRAAAQAEFDRMGTCWVGSPIDVLLDPHVEFPANQTYTQVSTQYGRTCALTTAGAVECCGRNDAILAAAARPTTKLEKIATGGEFTCGLDAGGSATCWGTIAPPPPGAFTKLAAGFDRACGIRRNGTLECWGSPTTIPPGTYIDVAIDMMTCGVHTDGTLACWGTDAPIQHPPGRFKAVAMDFATTCALRRDGTLGCVSGLDREDAMTVNTPMPDVWTDLTVAGGIGPCGLRADRTIACTDAFPRFSRTRGTPAPIGAFAQLSGDGEQVCGVSTAGKLACWGDPWPGRDTGAPTPSTGVHGKVVDEHGAPISNAEVLICDDESGVCMSVASVARTTSGTLATLVGAMNATKGWSISTTRPDGTWSAPTHGYRLSGVITAPGRELVEFLGQGPDQLVGPLVLRPASTVDITPWCDGHACSPSHIVEGHRGRAGTHLEHVAPGGYHFEVWSERGTKYEHVGDVEVEMPFAATPQTLHPALKKTGTGHVIRGRIDLANHKLEGIRVTVTCRGDEHAIGREAKTDAHGNFVVEDVGALPCSIQAMGGTADEMIEGSASIKAYSDRVTLELRADMIERPRH